MSEGSPQGLCSKLMGYAHKPSVYNSNVQPMSQVQEDLFKGPHVEPICKTQRGLEGGEVFTNIEVINLGPITHANNPSRRNAQAQWAPRNSRSEELVRASNAHP